LIVPQPGSPNLFYLFTSDAYQNAGVKGVHYNIVDMNANGGLGDVITKNVLLFAPSCEILHAVKHANCYDYWIIAQEITGIFRLYLLTSTGLSGPIINNVGIPFTESGWGQGKFSPNGKKFAVAHGNFIGEHSFQLFDFDDLTGTLSNRKNFKHN
ncbi:MAG: hypothetical protein M3R27_12245, partial [Bacteroidota bacterium]|nr:hypothetical protein [Bacteroidota bacterium]